MIYKCLESGNGNIVSRFHKSYKKDDYIHQYGGYFVIIATNKKCYYPSNILYNELYWISNKNKFREATKEEIKKLIPHLTNGKNKKLDGIGNVKLWAENYVNNIITEFPLFKK